MLENINKICIECDQEKGLDRFEIRRDSGKYRNTCKDCKNKRKSYLKKHPNVKIVEILSAGMKRCIDCKEIKEENEENFYIRQDNGKYRNQCIICKDKKCAIYSEKHKEEIKEYYQQYCLDNKERLKELHRARERKRRALKLEVKENYTPEDEKITRTVFNNKCFKCNNTNDINIDHHRPLIKGNALTVINAVLLCGSCNSKKRAKDPEKFYTEQELNEIDRLFKIAQEIKDNQVK